MAKGNMFLGMSRGSVGDVTFYRNRGNQIARARNRKPANPRSTTQVIQRMILATASKAYSRMKSIVDHSFENIEYGGRSQSYFLKRNLEIIRGFVASNYPNMTEESAARVVGLAIPNEPLANAIYGAGLLVSQGSLQSISPRIKEDGDTAGDLVGFGTIQSTGENPTVADILRSLGAAPGDQITICGINQANGMWEQSRYVINANATTEQLALAWDPSGAAAYFDAEKTLVGNLRAVVEEDYFTTNIPLWAWAMILSRKSGEKWLRSTQFLVYSSDLGDYITPDVVIAEWMAGTNPIDVANARFLNNAELGE